MPGQAFSDSDIKHIYSVVIKEHHLDSFGHVNNVSYFQLFEEARWQWITENGYGLTKVRSTGRGPVILEARARFKKELTLRTSIQIVTRLLEKRGKVFIVSQAMSDHEGVTYCSAEFTFGLFDTGTRRLVDPTPDWLKALGICD